jgi:Asp-tRNA(Asn)/Glu-tRNA(Gln) amidotransferase A subunit family amidase
MPTMNELIFGSIAEITAGYRDKKFSPLEVVKAHLERLAQLQPKLNAFVHLDAERALEQAEAATAAVMRGNLASQRPLHGIPLTIKSCMDVADWPAPAGSLLRKDYVAQADAPLVARLRGAGAILLGSTNTPEYLMAYETDNSVSGKTSNPWDLARSSGGSSGGEAAAIAAGCSVGGVGSDGGGSIRVPAHFCGICGLKPTPGRIPATGHFPPGGGAFGWIGVVGPMARTVGDLATLLSVMAGPDAGDALSAPVRLLALLNANFARGWRVGILESDALGEATPETTAAVEHAAAVLKEQKLVVETKRVTGLGRAIELWWYFFGPVIADSIRKGAVGHEQNMSPMLREYVALAMVEANLTYDGFLNACAERDTIRGEILRQLEDVQVLLSPVSTGTAFRHGEGNWRSGEKENYRDTMRYSQWLNLAGFPGVTVPMGQSKEGLPIGVQVIGKPYDDQYVLAVAEAIERGLGRWQAPNI